MPPQRAPSIGTFLIALASGALAGCSEAPPAQPSGAVGAAGSTATAGAAGSTASGGAGGAAGSTATAGAGVGGQGTSGGGGTGGSSGAASVGGSSGSAGTGGSGGRPSGPSVGCQTPVQDEEPGAPVQHDLTVNVAEKYLPAYATRKYYTNLPPTFDPAKPYPMLFYGQGCGQTGPENGPFVNNYADEILYIQLIPAAVDGSTVVPPDGSPGCFQAGREGLADSPDGPYFDQVLAEVTQRYCVDTGQVYVAGWSSGAWLSNYLACARGNVITGTAAGSGGLQHDSGPCTGGAFNMLLPGDAANTNDHDGFNIGAEPARDLFIAANGCSTTPVDMDFGGTTCQFYGDCAAPVAYCPGPGGHGGPLEVIAQAAWEFWPITP